MRRCCVRLSKPVFFPRLSERALKIMTAGGSLPKESPLFLGMVGVGFSLGPGKLATSVSRWAGFFRYTTLIK